MTRAESAGSASMTRARSAVDARESSTSRSTCTAASGCACNWINSLLTVGVLTDRSIDPQRCELRVGILRLYPDWPIRRYRRTEASAPRGAPTSSDWFDVGRLHSLRRLLNL